MGFVGQYKMWKVNISSQALNKLNLYSYLLSMYVKSSCYYEDMKYLIPRVLKNCYIAFSLCKSGGSEYMCLLPGLQVKRDVEDFGVTSTVFYILIS